MSFNVPDETLTLPAFLVGLSMQAKVSPLTLEDASFVSRCCGLEPDGALPTSEGREVAGAEALVRGLIRRNPSAGVRRGKQLVAW